MLGLPLTLAIVKSLIVEVDRERYAVPLSHVVETARVDPAAIHDINQQGVTIWRGHPVAGDGRRRAAGLAVAGRAGARVLSA